MPYNTRYARMIWTKLNIAKYFLELKSKLLLYLVCQEVRVCPRTLGYRKFPVIVREVVQSVKKWFFEEDPQFI